MNNLPSPKEDKPGNGGLSWLCPQVVDAAAMPMLRKTTKLPVFTPGMNDAERMLRMPVVFLGKEPGTAGR
ncbi:hypothetical protein LAC81_10110 [Ensifer adhaerens]|uniref:hypothetical protein n=1 Tax=Ensifer adhaerens TaxID=106592 RepID=UPI001CBCE18A|nr:hypothetical protein [Ensifer adhaerens]MBZ7922140.1 hypothetical protein [Ensifer adhaerens]UAX94522.1 hypothetical protein LAC78_10105 [Ensifer adhaerens]UAY02157.1 hypothetical protein LAC80_10115 [Ensifer adhaerens]UAY09540.1 hypothetical protein LAC81_10110 [Ensifer adhaerens]